MLGNVYKCKYIYLFHIANCLILKLLDIVSIDIYTLVVLSDKVNICNIIL